MATRKRKVSYPKLPIKRQFCFAEKGRFFDLRKIFDKLNARYFRNRLRGYSVVWGRKRKLRPREYMVFGTIQEEDRIIRIHPLLDRAFIPLWFLEYVVYHEMCHAVVPDRYTRSGRRVVQHDGIRQREKKYRIFKRAKRREEENLGRFLR